MDYTRTTYVSRVAWFVLLIIVVGYEIITLPKGHDDTLSDAVFYNIRFSNWTFLFMPLFTWLGWHWFGRTEKVNDYRDLIALGIGLVWAIVDFFFIRKA